MCPWAPSLGPLLPEISFHAWGWGAVAGVRACGAGDAPESPLPVPSHPGEAGGEGPVTRFSFQFGDEPEGDKRLERRRTVFKISQRKREVVPGRRATPGRDPRASPAASRRTAAGTPPAPRGGREAADASQGPSGFFQDIGGREWVTEMGREPRHRKWPRCSQALEGRPASSYDSEEK